MVWEGCVQEEYFRWCHFWNDEHFYIFYINCIDDENAEVEFKPSLEMSITHGLRGGHTSDDVTVTVAFNIISMLSFLFLSIISHHHLFLVILMEERKFSIFIPFQKTLWCYFDKVDKTFRDGSKIWEICLCLYHIWEGVKIFLRFNQLSNLLLFKKLSIDRFLVWLDGGKNFPSKIYSMLQFSFSFDPRLQ